jgi:hypothetical protein
MKIAAKVDREKLVSMMKLNTLAMTPKNDASTAPVSLIVTLYMMFGLMALICWWKAQILSSYSNMSKPI